MEKCAYLKVSVFCIPVFIRIKVFNLFDLLNAMGVTDNRIAILYFKFVKI